MITKLEIYAIVLAIVGLAAWGFGAYKFHQGVEQERREWQAKAAAATKADLESLQGAITNGTAIANKTLEAVGKIRVVNKTITNEVQREIQTNVQYANDCLPDAGLRLWNDANRGLLSTQPALPKSAAGGTQLLLTR